MIDFTEHPHRRFNPLTGEWLLCSPHRTKRPWQGQVEEAQKIDMPDFDPTCYLCPGNSRAGGVQTPQYDETFIFDNDFAALLPDTPEGSLDEDGLFRAESESGICRVICFSPKHNLTLALMETADIEKVINVWQEQYTELGSIDTIRYVQIFENRGAMMGCSNPHPHGQIWANRTIPSLPALECTHQLEYYTKHKSCLLCDYIARERDKNERIIFENDTFTALVPFWAVWPYETMIVPKVHLSNITRMNDAQKKDLADCMHRMGIRFDNLFKCSFPYSMGIHQEPTDHASHDEWHFHIHYYPPLLRSATVKKFMVGYEMLGMPQRDITAEQSAQKLRDCTEVHYTKQ